MSLHCLPALGETSPAAPQAARMRPGSAMRPAARPLLPLGSLVVKPSSQEAVSNCQLRHKADRQPLLSFNPKAAFI